MKTSLFLGPRRLHVELAHDALAGAAAALALPRELGADLLRRALAEPANLAPLRRLVAEGSPGERVELADDTAVVERLVELVRTGHLVVADVLLHRLSGLDGEPGTADAPAPSSSPGPEPAEPRTWIELELMGEDGSPIAAERYRIELPDGSTREGRLSALGLARVDGIDPGRCVVTFPDLDEEAWVPA